MVKRFYSNWLCMDGYIYCSYFHNFETTTWSTVYKHKPNEDFKLKLGYDSAVRLYWGSLWVFSPSY
jgi:hypothetical protein